MPKFEDLTGQRFGRLMVISRAEDYVSPGGKRTARWLCRCDCGKEIVMLRNTLKKATSCGCIRAEKAKGSMPDLAGQRFGRWTVLSKAQLPQPEANGTKTGWLCRCDCGTERILPSRMLTTGESTSCGCYNREVTRKQIARVVEQYDHTTISLLRRKAPNTNSKTGVRGVYWSAREQCYVAKIGLKNQSVTLGRFSSLEGAAAARRQAEKELFGPIIEAYDATKDEEDSHE